jgi:hypothetical protein
MGHDQVQCNTTVRPIPGMHGTQDANECCPQIELRPRETHRMTNDG